VALTPDGKTAFVTNANLGNEFSSSGDLVSTIDVKTRTKDTTEITVGEAPTGLAITPDGRTVFVANQGNASVSRIDVKTRTKDPTDIAVGPYPIRVAITPCRR
jgi:YVTN family beta-propeller protein